MLGPGEIASFHPESFAVLEGWGTQCRKSDFYDLMLPDFSLVFTREKHVHDARRTLWSRALSSKGICFPLAELRSSPLHLSQSGR
jgi:hypothetical protein